MSDNRLMDQVLRDWVRKLEKEWGCRPFVCLACQDGADEHWQIFNMDDEVGPDGLMPRYMVGLNAVIEEHP